MPYQIFKSDGTILATVADGTINSSACSVGLVGRGIANYGLTIATDLVHIVENFAAPTAPATPLEGQLWYNEGTNTLLLWNSSAWVSVGGSNSNSVTVTGPSTSGFIIDNPNAPVNSQIWRITVGDALSGNTGRWLLQSLNNDGSLHSTPLYVDQGGVSYTVAQSSIYADVAERFVCDAPMEQGDVVELGGPAEVQLSSTDASTEILGVVSTSPALGMNSNAGDDSTAPYIAYIGRLPCKIYGIVSKNQRIVASSYPGVARAMTSADDVRATIGRALADKFDSDGIALVEVVLGSR